MLVGDSISVLLQETLDLVCDIEGIMGNREGRVTEARLLEDVLVLGLHELIVQLLKERGIRTSWQTRFFVEQSEYTKFTLDHVDTWLVVGELDECPIDLLTNILLLFELEDVSIELHEW